MKKIYFIPFMITIFLFSSRCTFSPELNSSKQYTGIFSLVSSYFSKLSDALIGVSGTLLYEDGTPISNATLNINLINFYNLSKVAMDSNTTTDVSGNFSFNSNLGRYSIQVFSSNGTDLGSFEINITSLLVAPEVSYSGTKFKVVGLSVKPISNSDCLSGSSICGFIAGTSSSSGRFFVFGSASDSSTSSSSPVIYETLDGVNFTKNKITMGSCIPSSSSISNTECRITSVAFDGSKYFVMGVKSRCVSNLCTTSTTYAGTGSSLSNIVINDSNIPNPGSGGPIQNSVYVNGVFHYISFSGGTNSIISTSDGVTFTTYPTSGTGTTALQSNCDSPYIGENGYPFCGFRSYYNGGWTATTTSIQNSIPAANLNFMRGSFNKGIYQILTSDSANTTSYIYNGNGSLIPGGTFSTSSTPNFSGEGSLSNLFSTSTYIFGFLTSFTTTSNPPILNSISIVRSSDNGITYTLSGITLPTPITFPMGFGFTNSYIFLAGYTKDSSTNITKSYLFRSTDGTIWSTVILP